MNLKINMYADGACSGNPGPGGIGVILVCGGKRKELSQGYIHTTNNRMELRSVIAGFEALKTNPCDVTVYVDSKYVTEPFNQDWISQWKRKNFDGKANVDLWIRLLGLIELHNVNFVWVKGHATDSYNQQCDKLAVSASKLIDRIEDTEIPYKLTSDDTLFSFIS